MHMIYVGILVIYQMYLVISFVCLFVIIIYSCTSFLTKFET